MAGKPDNKQHKEADFGYFGKGIDGYVHYMQAFNRNFPKGEQNDLQSIASHKNKSNEQKAKSAQNYSSHVQSEQTSTIAPSSECFYYPPTTPIDNSTSSTHKKHSIK